MTIERQWLEIMKTEVPEAFTDDAPFQVRAGFIDAQIKLMSMPHEYEWDTFLLKQFRQPVESMFSSGADVVVVAFDDYANVPRAKAITQAKRRQRLVAINFTEQDELPASPPRPWDCAMANKVFKQKVVQWVTESFGELFSDLPEGKKIIVDWRGPQLDCWEGGATLRRERRSREQVQWAG